MNVHQNLPLVPHNVKFRVLVIGRANAGMTSILQRVCDTTESPDTYRIGRWGRREKVQLDASMERGLHNIEDELIFANHDGYVFHDSRGLESGSEAELKILQEFVHRRSRERRLKDRLHAIWFCIPMDNDRPSLDLRHFEHICPDKNVPVIAVFTKFDQFKRDIEMKLEDQDRDPQKELTEEVERIFSQHYLVHLRGSPYVRLERMHIPGQRCDDLLAVTANALSGDVVALMILAVQKDNLESSKWYDLYRTVTIDGQRGRFPLHNALGSMVTKHPKAISIVSVGLITVGGIVWFPGLTARAASRCKLLAHPAMTVAKGVSALVGKWLKASVGSASEVQARPGDRADVEWEVVR